MNCLRDLLKSTVVVIITTTTTSMDSISNYIPETNPVSRVYSVASVLQLQFMVHVMLFVWYTVLHLFCSYSLWYM
jgi:hypothetical protein